MNEFILIEIFVVMLLSAAVLGAFVGFRYGRQFERDRGEARRYKLVTPHDAVHARMLRTELRCFSIALCAVKPKDSKWESERMHAIDILDEWAHGLTQRAMAVQQEA